MVKHTLQCEGVNIGRFLKPLCELLEFSEKRFSIQSKFILILFSISRFFLNEFACAYVSEKYDVTGV